VEEGIHHPELARYPSMVVQVEVQEQDFCGLRRSDSASSVNTIMPAETNGGGGNGGNGAPRASLLCRPNSHPFQDRMLSLDSPVKVGRSVARARPIQTNAIFDCKVLSRNHALLWYENGKFYLQDTKSSNGTFVNNQRLSKGSEESPPREVCSGDILQFGVDVMENSRKVTHGCIIATLKLYLPDGKEAKASPSIVNSSPGAAIPAQDLYQLNQYIQEALAREQFLESKLLSLQRLIGDTEVASSQGWRALMDEDRLLTRVEILESQLTTYGKAMTEDKLREETKRLMSDKESYQTAAKENLKRLVDEKLEASKRLKEVETSLSNLEEEYSSLHQLYDKVVEENKRLSEKMTGLAEEVARRREEEAERGQEGVKPAKTSELYIENETFSENGGNDHNSATETNGKYDNCENDFDKTENDLVSSTDSLDGELGDEDEDEEEDVVKVTSDAAPSDLAVLLREGNRLRATVEEMTRARVNTDNELVNLRINLEEAKNENVTILQELEKTRLKVASAERAAADREVLAKKLEELSKQATTSKNSENASKDTEAITNMSEGVAEQETVVSLKDRLRVLEAENAQLKAKYASREDVTNEAPALQPLEEPERTSCNLPASTSSSSLLESSSSLSILEQSTSSTSALEQSLEEAESRIASLLSVKDRLVTVQEEKSRLEVDVSALEEELETLAAASRTLTACTVLPLIVLIIAIVTAFLPLVSQLFGTRDF